MSLSGGTSTAEKSLSGSVVAYVAPGDRPWVTGAETSEATGPGGSSARHASSSPDGLEWVAGQTAEDRVSHARGELEARGLVA